MATFHGINQSMSCEKCKQVIRLQKAHFKGKDYHNGCFVCEGCKRSLHGSRDIQLIGGSLCHPGCLAQTQHMCVKCGREVLGAALEYANQMYHENCFRCSKCNKTLAGFEVIEDPLGIYHKSCHDDELATGKDCNICGGVIDIGVNFIEYKEQYLHKKCFVCHVCKTQLKTNERFNDVSSSVKLQLRCTTCAARMRGAHPAYKASPFKYM